MALNVLENKFVLPIEVDASGLVSKELKTENTFVDKNIKVEVNVPAGNLSNTAESEDKIYTTEAGPVLISGDYLYINAGYIKDTKIPLADLVPDVANVAAGVDGNSHLIYNTVSVYDKDGQLIAGTMGDSTHTIESQPINAVEPTVDVSFSVKKGDTEIELLTDIPEGEYLTIGAAGLNTEGSLSTTVSCSSTKGYVSEDDTKTVNIDETINAMISTPANKYIKIYAGEIIEA